VLVLLFAALAELPIVVVDRDDVRIETSCTIRIARVPLIDAAGDGVIQVVADGVTVDFAGARLHGAENGATADSFDGIGVRITAKSVTLKNARVSGFRGGIWATAADGLVLENCDVSGNRRQRLRSTEKAEEQADWLWPHENDANEWLVNYGAGIYVEESKHVTVRGCRARRGQNGLLLRRVDDSEIVDNDFSFLSGWGLGMFRCERDRVHHNAFDFCVRGYSHGVYSRGQDSAGILFFEQNKDNVIAFNSATHSGDGFFGFAGKAALERSEAAPRAGNVGNLLWGNDFSYAPAIGIEMTFSFDNVFARNKLVGGNYGIWGGYSSDTRVLENEIAENALAGIAVEHGSNWTIAQNSFRENAKGVEFWWDEDTELLATPWAKVNPTDSAGHRLHWNSFERDRIGIEARGTRGLRIEGGMFTGDGDETRIDERSDVTRVDSTWPNSGLRFPDPRVLALAPAKTKPVGARAHLDGRDKIIVTEWGPYDWEAPYLQKLADERGAHVYRVLGVERANAATIEGQATATLVDGTPQLVHVTPKVANSVTRYRLSVETPSVTLLQGALLVDALWRVRVFPWTQDPRTELEAWRAEASDGIAFERASLDLPFANGGASELSGIPDAVRDARLPSDRFGTIAETTVTIPAGRWRLRTLSDDGVRVRLDERVVVERWDWHVPTEDVADFDVDAARVVRIAVEHFELDGYATLSLTLEPRD
jgi:parallel beta-helix repeat protein